ncbi:MAG: hypothetical protein BWX84_01884 [Verrucomicrobia bacterium ADurb.Bin118]|nr:MAG: hypothetical protein BWX84_01884 [Verrucomicrobia bacterium ADurb.Bin118]
MSAPIMMDTPTRMPIKPPAAIMTKSVSGRTVSSRKSTPPILSVVNL